MFAPCYALFSSSSSPLSKSIIAFLKRQLTDKAFTSLFHSTTPHLITHLMTLVTLTPHYEGVLTGYGLEDFHKSLIQLSRQKEKEGTLSPGEWLCRAGDGCVLTLLLHVKTSLYSQFRVERQWEWMVLLRALFDTLDACVVKGAVMRMTIDLLVHLLDESHSRFAQKEGGPEATLHLLSHLMHKLLTLAWPTDRPIDSADSVKATSHPTDLTAEDVGQHIRYVTLTMVRFADSEAKQRLVAPVLRSFLELVPPSHGLMLDRLQLLARHPCLEGMLPSSATASLDSLLSSFLLCFDDLSGHLGHGLHAPDSARPVESTAAEESRAH